MQTTFGSHNGNLVENSHMQLSINNIEFTYGFGVYENIRLRNGALYFLDVHIDRLFSSAKLIGLTHDFSKEQLTTFVTDLIKKNHTENNLDTSNIKILLIGGSQPQLFISQLAPRFIEKKLYKTGVKTISKQYERFLPQAKSLNMLPSYLIYSEARNQGAYDAILYDAQKNIHEGTRSNVFFIKEKQLFTPPEEIVLSGVTRKTVIECALQNGYTINEQSISYDEINSFEGAFLTSTSAKILPIQSIDGHKYEPQPEHLKKLIKLHNEFVAAQAQLIL